MHSVGVKSDGNCGYYESLFCYEAQLLYRSPVRYVTDHHSSQECAMILSLKLRTVVGTLARPQMLHRRHERDAPSTVSLEVLIIHLVFHSASELVPHAAELVAETGDVAVDLRLCTLLFISSVWWMESACCKAHRQPWPVRVLFGNFGFLSSEFFWRELRLGCPLVLLSPFLLGLWLQLGGVLVDSFQDLQHPR